MSDIHIRRDHQLGLARARALASRFTADAGKQFGLTCVVTPGDQADEVAISRSGLDGRLIVAPDHFTFDAKLGMMLSALRKTVETEIGKSLDALLKSEVDTPPKV